MKSLFKKILDLHWFNRKRLITGIQCTDTAIRFASFHMSKKSVELHAYGEHMLSGDIIKDGALIKPQALTQALMTLRKKYKLKDIHLVLPEEQSFIFHTSMPYSDGDNFETAIKDHIDAYLELHDKEFEGSFTCEGDILGIHDGSYELQITVTPDSVLSSYKHACQAAGFSIQSMEVGAHMVSRACLANAHEESCLLVDFGEEKTHISLVSEEHIMEHETHHLGSKHLIPEIQDFLNVTQADAERIHRDYGLSRNHREPALLARLAERIAPLRKALDRMYVAWHTRDYKTKKQQHPITKIVLVGEGAHLKGFAEHIAVTTRIPVEHAHVWHATDAHNYIPEIPQHESHRYAHVISAALKGVG